MGEPSNHAINTTLGKAGIGICVDNQKADVAAAMSRQPVDIALMPHSTPVPSATTGIFTKEKMTQTLETIAPLYASLLGVPVVLANKCGPWLSPLPGPQLVKQSGSFFPGLATIIDSDGTVKARLGDQEGVIIADVTLDPARKTHGVPPRCGRCITRGPPLRVVLRLIKCLGQLSYAQSSTRRSRARSVSRG